jgi:hypothetical protein
MAARTMAGVKAKFLKTWTFCLFQSSQTGSKSKEEIPKSHDRAPPLLDRDKVAALIDVQIY